MANGLSNAQIGKAMRRVRNFLGVFSANQNPLILIKSFPCCFIMNTKPAPLSGHWLAFYLLSPTRLEFFDSLGFPLAHYAHLSSYFSQFISVHSNTNNILQSSNSSLCGEYCIAFLQLRSISHIQFTKIICLLSRKTNSLRDSYVSRFRLLLK